MNNVHHRDKQRPQQSGALPLRKTFLATAVAVLAAQAIAAPPTRSSEGPWAKGRVVIATRAGLSQAEIEKILKPHGAKAQRLGGSDLYVVELPANASETAVAAQLAHNPHLKFAELDRQVKPDFTPNDPYGGSEWHLPIMNAPVAWDTAQGSGVTIAILDTGVLPSHPDLVSNLVPGYNSYDGSNQTSDVQGHGTAVAGAAAAVTNNGTGVAGVAGASKIMPIRITDAAGNAYYSTIASAITYAADRGVRVVNCSYGYLFKNSSVQNAGSYLKSKGGLLVVSAGNYGVDENSPAISSMITVSATGSSDALTGWSSFGNMVSVAAPGEGIWTTSADGTYRSASGTSFSAPITAGVVALMMSANSALSSSQIEKLLFASAKDLGSPGWDIYYGNGRVDAYAAVQAAKGSAAADTQAPSVAITSPGSGSTVNGVATVDATASDNVGVSKVELRANGGLVATSTVAPYQFSWDTTKAANGSNSLTAVAYDAAGNSKGSTAVSVNVSNNVNVVADATPPLVTITNPGNGVQIKGNLSVAASATDNAGAAGIKQTLYIDGVLKASANGGSLSYNWNTRKASAGAHTVQVIAQDAAGNKSSASVQVSK